MTRLLALALLVAAPLAAQAPDHLGETPLDRPKADVVATQPVAPETFAFQGVLEDGGQPVADGTRAVQVRLFDVATGGTALYAEDHSAQTSDGVFALSVGAGVTAAGDFGSVNFSEAVYVEVVVDGVALSPRTVIAPVPVARTLRAGAVIKGDREIRVENTSLGQSAVGIEVSMEATSSGAAVMGTARTSTGRTFGVRGNSWSTEGVGVYGENTAHTGATSGVHGYSLSTSGRGVYGTANATSGLTRGVDGRSASTGGRGVYGEASATSGTTIGVLGASVSTAGSGVVGSATAISGPTYGVRGEVFSPDGYAGHFDGGRGLYARSRDGASYIITAYSGTNLRFRVESSGTVRADGSFIGGGADLAEFFPLDASGTTTASVRPGDLVGLRGGAVSLAASGAEQVMIASSDPAFVGNPDAEVGGALVALVGQAEVRLSGAASVGDLLVASGRDDGTARAVTPEAYRPEADGPVAGRVLSVPEAGRVVALVGVDEAAALRAVVARQQAQIDALTARLDALVGPEAVARAD